MVMDVLLDGSGRRGLRRVQLRLGDVGDGWRALLLGAPPALF